MTNMHTDGVNDEIGDSSDGGGRGGNDDGDDDNFFCFQDEQETVGLKQSEPPGKVDSERNKNLN